jgi:hypothetical protein
MKNKLFALLITAGLLGSSAAFAQDETHKTDKKERKVVKKEMKGKPHKAMKKAVKAEKKDDMGK